MIKIEIQHFHGCPNSGEMIDRVKKAILELGIPIEYSETYVETSEHAAQVKFRGSPTLLINGFDFEHAPEPVEAHLACRYYPNGLPSVDQIKQAIIVER